jgi:hypothetical protein
MQNVRTIDLSSAITGKSIELGMKPTRIRVVEIPSNADVELSVDGGPYVPVTHAGQLFLPPCQGGQRKGIDSLTYTAGAASGELKLFYSDDGSDVDFSGASASSDSRRIVLATIVPRGISASLITSDPNKDTADPLSTANSGDGTAHIVYDGTKEIIGARYQVPAGGTNYSHAGGKLQDYALPLAQLLNTQTLTNHRGRPWYVELADTVMSTYSGTNTIYRGMGFGEINNTVAGWTKPFVGFISGKTSYWVLYARDDTTAGIINTPLTGYDPAEIHALKLRVGQDGSGPYVAAYINGTLVARETLPLSVDLADLGSYALNPYIGCSRALAAESVEIWGLLDGAMTLDLVFPEG